MRLDLYIKDKMSLSRSKARELIENGCVRVNGRVVIKPAYQTENTDNVDLYQTDNVLKYVSRGGYKLKKALSCFEVDVNGLVCIDIGASTGGFTDCLLQNGAKRIYAIDVGSSQLSPALRQDNRVTVMENTDIRCIEADKTEPADIITVDVSFISLEKIMDNISALLSMDGLAILLVKPQFEAGREYISSGGIVKNKKVHLRVIKKVADCALEKGLGFKALTFSPIKGGSGNIEYLLCVKKGGSSAVDIDSAKAVVDKAWEDLR